MTDFIDGLERDLVAAARRRAAAANGRAPARRRLRLRSFLLAAGVIGLTTGTAAAGTLLALRGSAIPAPQAVPPEQTPIPATSHVSSLRAADPEPGAPPWTVRVARSQTGLVCSTVGQVRDGRFGLVGLDHRFRTIAEGVSDSCGATRKDAASLIGARVFDAARRADVRTVVSGVAGDALRRVTIEAAGRTIHPPIADGVFLTVLRGYPEDAGVRATLTFASGRREVHDLGRSPGVVADPDGGPAWRVEGAVAGGDDRTCTIFTWARRVPGAPFSPAACGRLRGTVHRTGWYFAVRRIAPGTGGPPFSPFGAGMWGRHPARTAVWGGAGEDVASVTVQAGSAAPQPVSFSPGGVFLDVLPAKVDPAGVVVRLKLKSGRTVVAHGSTNLVPGPEGPR